MRARTALAAGIVFLTACATASAQDFPSVAAHYPEGPTVVGDALYWAEMESNRVRRWRDGRVSTVWRERGCGPTAVETAGDDEGFWVLCHRGDAVVRLNDRFREEFRVTEVVNDGLLTLPNDGTPDGEGGVFVSSSGVFSLEAPATGRVIHIKPDGQAETVFSGLRYANGVAYDAEAEALYVSEHLVRRVWRVERDGPAEWNEPEVFARLGPPSLEEPVYELSGPDGLLPLSDGGLIVAEYGAGRLHQFDAAGERVASAPAPAQFVTNMVPAPFADGLVVTSSFVTSRPPRSGVVAFVGWNAFELVGEEVQ